MKSETIINELFIVCYIKIHWRVLYFDDTFTRVWFCNFMFRSCGKCWFIDVYHYAILKKSHSLIITLMSSEESLSIWKLWSSWWWIQDFQNFNFHLNHKSYHWQQYCHFFPLRLQIHFAYFWENTKYSSLDKSWCVCQLFFQIKMVFHETRG